MIKKIFIGVAWPYVNGNLHLGHLAGYSIPCDVFARYNRLKGNDVLMVSGSDCYGTPTTIEADKLKVKPSDIVEKYHPLRVKLFKDLDISYDLYTRTDTENHTKVTQDQFLKLLQNGYIIKKKTKQFFSEADNKFLPDRYVEGQCPNCKSEKQRSDQCEACGKLLIPEEVINPYSKITSSPVVLKETEHYFIDLPKLAPKLKEYLNEHKDIWWEQNYKEPLSFLELGLQPRAITRDIDWGVPLPDVSSDMKLENAENKRFYVWFDAVIGYLSASIEWAHIYYQLHTSKFETENEIWESYWKDKDCNHYYFMGKDNLLFHTILWPAQLIGSDNSLNLPYFIARYQFYNLQGKKFSKSRKWIIDSREFLDKFGPDATRFFIALNLPENKDGNFTWRDFIQTNNSILVGDIGNFINRTLSFISTKYDGIVPSGEVDKKVLFNIDDVFIDTDKHLEKVEIVDSLNRICKFSNFANKYFNDSEVWKVFEKDKNKADSYVISFVQIISALAVLLAPFMPDAVRKIWKELGRNPHEPSKGDDLWKLIEIPAGTKINFTGPIFKKIDIKVISEEEAKLKAS